MSQERREGAGGRGENGACGGWTSLGAPPSVSRQSALGPGPRPPLPNKMRSLHPLYLSFSTSCVALPFSRSPSAAW
eukprot:895326-Rhodomonas_salina.2